MAVNFAWMPGTFQSCLNLWFSHTTGDILGYEEQKGA